MNKKIISIIPARGGSKGVLKKNIKKLNGIPLVAYGILSSLNAKTINRTIVSTDDEEISKISKKYGAEVIMRPKELAQDESPSEEALIHVTNKLTKQGYKPDIIILTQCTCPYRLSKDIDDAVNILLKNNHSGVASVSKIPGHFHPYKIKKIKNNELISLIQEKNYPEKIIDIKYYRRQDLPGKYYWMNGAVYVMTYDTLINQKNRYGKNCGAIILPEERLINIDTKLDFKFAEFLIKNKNIKLDFKLEEL